MSIGILADVYRETRRLAIAGSVVAPGDFRLQKLIEPLNKLGEKAPVFLRVAQCVEQVIQSSERTASAALLELASLVGSILYTQGTTGVEGELADLPPCPLASSRSQISARLLKPLLAALTSTGSGRLEQIKSAYEMSLFHDLRLVRPALQALDDSYAEIRDFVAQKILPLYGRAILDDLKVAFDIKGNVADGQRLTLIHSIAPEEARELVMKALEDGSKEVKLAAIECLGNSDEDLNYLLQQARARSKDVRAAALLSLARIKSRDAQTHLAKTLDSKDVGLLVRAAEEVAPQDLIAGAVERARSELATLPGVQDTAQQKAAVERLLSLLHIATARLDTAGEQLLMDMLDHASTWSHINSDPGKEDLITLGIKRLSAGSQKGAQYLVSQREMISVENWPAVVFAARRGLEPAQFFQTFVPYLESEPKSKSRTHPRTECIVNHLTGRGDTYCYEWNKRGESPLPPLDPAWLDAAIKLDRMEVVRALASTPNASLHKYLSDKRRTLKTQGKTADDWALARAMLDSRHPEAEQFVLERVRAVKNSSTYWHQTMWTQLGSRLSASAIPELEAMIADPRTNNHFGKELLEAVRTIRNRSQSS